MKKTTKLAIVKITLVIVALSSLPIIKAELETAPADNPNQTEKTPSDKIIGTWKRVGISPKISEDSNEIYPGVYSVPPGLYYNFKSGGEFLAIDKPSEEELEGKWVLKSDKMSITLDEFGTVDYILKLNDATHMYLLEDKTLKRYYEKVLEN
jgi:hypothetical protein